MKVVWEVVFGVVGCVALGLGLDAAGVPNASMAAGCLWLAAWIFRMLNQ